MLNDLVEVLGWLEPVELVPFLVGDPDVPVVEVDVVILVNQTRVVGVKLVRIVQDKANIVLVGQYDIIEHLERELCELNAAPRHVLDALPLLLVESLADPAWDSTCGMCSLPADHLGDLLAVGPVLDYLLPHVQPDLLEDSEDVPLARRRVWAYHEVRSAQEVEVEGVVVDEVASVHELPELLGGLCGLHVERVVKRLCRGEVVCRWAYTADPGGDYGHVLSPSTLTEALEAP